MADFEENFERSLNEAFASLSLETSFELKKEQRDAVKHLASNQDVLAVLPTGFGKSLIFRLLVRVKQSLMKKHCCVLVVCPLKSIVEDQLVEAKELGLRATSLADGALKEEEEFDLIFGSAEDVLASKFISLLKNKKSKLKQAIEAVVVDESHTVETWTGERAVTKKGKKASAFRESFGKLSMLRSFCKPGTPVAAITGTADECTQRTIQKVLCLKNPLIIYVSPNRKNLRFYVEKVKKHRQLSKLQWLVKLAKENGIKTIIFCTTMNDISTIVNYLICQLGSAIFCPPDSRSPEDSLLGIYHSNSWQSNKDLVIKSFKGDGKKRIVVATTALCMGVNFPDVRYIINWGPARTILDQHQQAGRAGRDGKLSHIIVVYRGQQAGPCEKEVKEFVRTTECFRVAAYKSLDTTIKPGDIPHECCVFCAKSCKCDGGNCSGEVPLFEQNKDETTGASAAIQRKTRTVTAEDREDLKCALLEVQQDLKENGVFSESAKEWFSMALIDDVVTHSEEIFSIDDLTSKFPVFSLDNALRVLEVVQEVFLDIPYFEETMLHLTTQGMCLEVPPMNWIDFNDSTLYSDSYDSDSEELERAQEI